jgi:hypothetical protein
MAWNPGQQLFGDRYIIERKPPEQYVPDAERGEYIDVYALAATLYSLLTRQLPMPAPARLQNFTMRSPKDLNSSVVVTMGNF